MKLVTAEQMRELDRRATEDYGIPGIVLMENAGLRAFDAAREMLNGVPGKRVVVIAGRGNNGGDGFCIARHLANAGARVECFLAGEVDQVSGDARVNLDSVLKMGISVQELESVGTVEMPLRHADLVIDSLLGTGIKGEVTGLVADLIDAINACGRPALSIDVPSGLISDTGAIAGRCARAARTVTFGLPKIGLVFYPGAGYVGDLTVADIGIPREALQDSPSRVWLTEAKDVARRLPARPPDAHKGTFGHLAVIAGSVGFTGAAAMTSESAARAGAGLVTLGCPSSLNDILGAKLTEVMTLPMPETPDRSFAVAAIDKALELIERCDALAIGPGLSRNPETVRFVNELLPRVRKPMVIDADGLNALAEDASTFAGLQAPTAITPHPGEMARLIGTTSQDVQSDRLKTALEGAKRFGVVCVLKGARTVIASPDGDAYVNPTGHVAMASGGVGDVMTGVIGGLLAQGLSPMDACIAGAYLHGLAGEIAAENVGAPGALASDVLLATPEAFRIVMSTQEDLSE